MSGSNPATAAAAVELYSYGVRVPQPTATAAGTSGTSAQAIQGVTNGVAINTKAPSCTPLAGTGLVTTGGTAVAVFSANTIVNGAYITNPSTATEALFVSMTGTATLTVGAGIELIPIGGTWRAPGPLTTAVSANATTSGHVFVAVRY